VTGCEKAVVNGVSTRKVEKVVQEICGTSFSKSTVSNLCKDLYKDVEAFRTRPLNGPYPFLTVDATYFKVRENHRIISKAFMIAYGTNSQGVREILGFDIYPEESTDHIDGFTGRADAATPSTGPLYESRSDAHGGIKAALCNRQFPEAPWQRFASAIYPRISLYDWHAKTYQAASIFSHPLFYQNLYFSTVCSF
jgi:putative transposase